MPTKIKYYTVRINLAGVENNASHWYLNKEFCEFKTKLEIGENKSGKQVPVFRMVDAPFWTISPMHCDVVKEQVVETGQ